MRIIGTLLAVVLTLIGILVVSAISMPLVAFVIRAENWGRYGEISIVYTPVVIAILSAIFLSFSDKLFIKSFKYRKASEDEYKRLKESGALNVLEKSKAKIKNVLISDDNTVNACAIGSETVVFNAGMLSHKEISDDMICGVAAHEAGHIFKGDSKISRMFYVFFIAVVVMEQLAVWVINGVGVLTRLGIPLLSPFCWLLYWVMRLYYFIFIQLLKASRLINCGVSRNMEFAADKYAYKEGYGEGLKKTLELFDKWEKEREKEGIKNKTLREKLTPTIVESSKNLLDTHPASEKRIEALEKLDAEKNLT